MSDDSDRGRAVPSGRLARLGQFGRLAGGVAGGMIAEGARRLADGERPTMRDMMLTPGNVARVADRLSHLRGAAMKLGQMISMDAGDMLPPELTEIMARLRQNAYRMPPAQLQQVLAGEWGKTWRTRFTRFDAAPLAAASIGQVHRAITRDGRDLAIKVQYPGVRESIEADVDNVATLLRVSGLLPPAIDVAPLLAEAKRQLAEEADYLREGEQMTRFGALLADAPGYVVPTLDAEFTTPRVLAMSFIEGRAIETLGDAPQETRDVAMRHAHHAWCCANCSSSARCRPIPTSPTIAGSPIRSGWWCSISAPRARFSRPRPRAIAGCCRAVMAGDRDAVREAATRGGRARRRDGRQPSRAARPDHRRGGRRDQPRGAVRFR